MNVGRQNMIDKQITKYFERRSTPRATRKHSGKVPASQLYKAVGCETQQELISYLTGVEKPVSRRLERIFALGHAIEDLVLEDFALSQDWTVSNKQLVLENHFLKGAIDCTVNTFEDGRAYIVDVKSMNDINYATFACGIVPPYIQVQLMCYIYLWRTTTKYAPVEDVALILGYNKNDSRVRAVPVIYDEVFLKTYLQEAERIFNNKQRRAT